ncbi:Nramp family divalent metal transporter [Corynebacterium senegalense]|uniref:Nramp family divalent metal transporter n=1 Tax=Corynebacterium senegalense TaxID=2080750 RepID=UPI000E1FEEB9|nr:Nramp family divalent metal transporter [Corynebacterium senegalense]
MSSAAPTPPAPAEPATKWSVIGPGLVAAATGVGSGDLVATLIAGQKYGYALLWACIAGSIMKIVLVEGVGRYTLATGNTMFHGWRQLGRWTSWYFVPYIIIWGFVYGAAAMSASAMPLKALFPGTSLEMWAVLTGLLGFIFTWLGKYRTFEKIIAVLVGVMFLTVCGIATLSLSNLPEILRGLVPTIPEGSFVYVLSLAGGVGGTITLAAYGYWLTEKNWRGPAWMRVMRLDNTVAYIVTGIFVAAMLVIGADLLYSANIAVSQGDRGLLDLADVLEQRYGPTMAKVFLFGFWAAAFSSVLGVWNGVSLMFADFVGHAKHLPADHADIHVGGRYYRWYLLWLTFPPMLLFFLGKPTALVIAYGVLGALFMPFLGLTLLLLLNSRHTPKRWRNGWVANTLMALISAAFVYICATELWKLLPF